MAKYIRYTLATCFFAASVACLALWWRTEKEELAFVGAAYFSPGERLRIDLFEGKVLVSRSYTEGNPYPTWQRLPKRTEKARESLHSFLAIRETFSGTANGGFHFPLWYPALVFALTGVGILRIGRFTIRSALIATTIIAALLGMAVAL